MEAQPPPYPADPSAGYPPQQQQQPGYDPAAAAPAAGYPAQGYGYAPQTDVKPGAVDAYGQPVVAGGYPQQPPGYQPYPTAQGPPPTSYATQQQTATTVSSQYLFILVS